MQEVVMAYEDEQRHKKDIRKQVKRPQRDISEPAPKVRQNQQEKLTFMEDSTPYCSGEITMVGKDSDQRGKEGEEQIRSSQKIHRQMDESSRSNYNSMKQSSSLHRKEGKFATIIPKVITIGSLSSKPNKVYYLGMIPAFTNQTR